METLAYKYQPAGQESPNQSRKYTPHDGLTKLLEKWLDMQSDYCHFDFLENVMYKEAFNILKEADLRGATDKSIISAALPLEGHPKLSLIGSFFSAAFNLSDERTFIYEDMEVFQRLFSLGGYLSKEKTLVVNGDVGDVGDKAEGTVINYGNCKSLGHLAIGPVINYGEVRYLATQASGPVINFGEANQLGGTKEPIANYGFVRWLHRQRKSFLINLGTLASEVECVYQSNLINYGSLPRGRDLPETAPLPKLMNYLDNLNEKIGPHRSIEEVVKELENRDIKKELKKVIPSRLMLRLHNLVHFLNNMDAK